MSSSDPVPTINELVESARMHFDNVQADIRNASNRIEHIRLTTLAQEAGHLLTKLERFALEEERRSSGNQLPTNLFIESTAGAAIALPITSGDKNSVVMTRAVAGGCCGGSNSCVCG
jgi:hypothetical protein